MATNITPTQRILTDDNLRDIADFDTALAQLQGDVVSADEHLGTGFLRTENKDQLIGIPFLAVQWTFREGDFGKDSEYVELFCITRENKKIVITDGGQGIYAQLRVFTDNNSGRTTGLMCPAGLSSSEYQVCDSCRKANSLRARECRHCGSDELKPAETHYIAQQA